MTDARCEPPADLRGGDGWHWLEVGGAQFCHRWRRARGEWGWATIDQRSLAGMRYLSPVATPAEVEALKRERDEIKAAHEELANADYRWAKENAALRERVRALEGALRPFAAISARFPDAKGWASLGIHVPEMPTFADCHAARAALTPSGDGA